MKPHTANIIRMDARHPSTHAIDQAAAVIRNGGLAVFPTHGLYGLGADARNPQAVQQVFTLKGRDPEKPLLVLIHHRKLLPQIVASIPPLAKDLMHHFWPGRITLVLQAKPNLPAGLIHNGKIGIRLTAHPIAVALTAALNGPLTGTSANLTGNGGCAAIEDLDEAVKKAVDIIIDVGCLAGGPGSTVIDATGSEPSILRPGSVSESEIIAALEQQKSAHNH